MEDGGKLYDLSHQNVEVIRGRACEAHSASMARRHTRTRKLDYVTRAAVVCMVIAPWAVIIELLRLVIP